MLTRGRFIVFYPFFLARSSPRQSIVTSTCFFFTSNLANNHQEHATYLIDTKLWPLEFQGTHLLKTLWILRSEWIIHILQWECFQIEIMWLLIAVWPSSFSKICFHSFNNSLQWCNSLENTQIFFSWRQLIIIKSFSLMTITKEPFLLRNGSSYHSLKFSYNIM